MTKTPQELAELFLSASEANRRVQFGALLEGLREATAAGCLDEAVAALRSVVLPTMDYTSAQSLLRVFKQLLGRVQSRHKIKLAVTGSFTTSQLVSLIQLHLFAAGIDADIYEADYGVFRQEILDSSSGLYAFTPQVLFLATTWRDLAHRPESASDLAEEARRLEAEQRDWSGLWQAVKAKLRCEVIQNNFVLPSWRAFANYEMRQPGSLTRHVAGANRSMEESAPSFVTIHDVDHLASIWGRWSWDDPRFFNQAKLPCAPEYLVDYAHSVASLIAAKLGLARKCLVLDLDNTLWGGVIGDDGLGGIRLGQGDPEGEAFQEFQKYVMALRRRGVLLAVCSKNREETALEVFEKHPEMVLRRDDISCFIANWEDKATNLSRIAKALNIGRDALVFVDDNPAERSIVRQVHPEVAVPELPDDVTGYVKAIEQQRYFQALSVGAEDLQRTEYYRADAIRHELQCAATDMESYLRSLGMFARISTIDASCLERSVQLIQRSNQFNLTTRRRSAAEVSALLLDPSWITRTVSLKDRFGDNGLISVLLAQVRRDYLEIDTWLMSCRVLKRGVEHFLLHHLWLMAGNLGLKSIRGKFIPTPKNELVRKHYAELGFTPIGHGSNGETAWELSLAETQPTWAHFIIENNIYE